MRTIFVDRDGVINKDPGGWTPYSYVTSWDEFHFLPGALEALAALTAHGIEVIVISNQAGVAKGYFTEERLRQINEKMVDEITRAGGRIRAVYYCVHRKEDNCDCRKPRTGLIERAAAEHHVDVRESLFIGDSVMDIEAGKRAGLETILVFSGKTDVAQIKTWNIKPDRVFQDLRQAAAWVIEKENKRRDCA